MRVPAGEADGASDTGDAGTALKRVMCLLDPPPAVADTSRGYLDLIGASPPEPTGVTEWLMRTGVVPAIYQRWWRPALGWVAMGGGGPSMTGEYRLARSWLTLSAGDTLLDLACGPGNFTRELAAGLGQAGLVIGLDASASMLARAVRDTPGTLPGRGGIAYVRADAMDFPLRPDCVDGVCCFAALHLMREPFRAVDKMTSVLRPGGRIALMTSCRRGTGGALRAAGDVAGRMAGMALFGRDEITDALAERGYTDIRQRIAGAVQFVGGRLQVSRPSVSG